MRPATSPHAAVLVFGDLGRSPRMLNHAAALAANGFRVSLIGYPDTPVPASVAARPEICLCPIRTLTRCPESFPRIAFLAWTCLRMAAAQLQALWILLIVTPKPEVVLVQNPPAIPTLLAGRLTARLRNARFVIDWHNFGYSMLALRLGGESAWVRRLHRHEAAQSRRADAHLCVSSAMSAELAARMNVSNAVVLYDRPLELREPPNPPQRRALLRRLLPNADVGDDTLVLHCPTSWTDDEDTGLLLEAAPHIAARSPRVLIVVTGMGPRRDGFERRLAASAAARRCIVTAFFSAEDYRLMLGAADCGLSLHRSSSGVDLPMKIVDFFGAGAPALVLDYGPCIREQVEEGREALLFKDASGLSRCIVEISAPGRLETLRHNVRPAWRETWEEAWRREALPLLAPRP